jgi:hypothetical protein
MAHFRTLWRNLLKIVSILIICLPLAACHRQTNGPKFIDSPGFYVYFDGKLKIEIPPNESGKLNYRISTGKISVGPSEPALLQNQPWFIYPESERSIWTYNGTNGLTLTEISPDGGAKFTSSLVITNLPQRAPPEVQNRLPKP